MSSCMAQRRLQIALSDVDRGVYDTLELSTAQHPSESDAYYVTRALAMALYWEEGLAFSRGLGEPDEPALWTHDPTGQVTRWVELGRPKPDRLEKALRACKATHVICHRPDTTYRDSLSALKFPKGGQLTYLELSPHTIDELAAATGDRASWTLTISEGTAFLEADGHSWTLELTPVVLP
jgi:uncharacterized protein YaeQ